MAKNITGLGRGLGALIDTENISTGGSSSINEVDMDLIFANPNQPRTHFDEESLTELASSIRELGVISPITLRKNDNGTYLIIAGERRFRASKLIGLKSIPAYVKTAADEQVVEMALIENIQREDLNAIEIALTFYRLMEEYKLTQERLSERVGKKRTTVANYLRLLRLPAEIQMGIKDKKSIWDMHVLFWALTTQQLSCICTKLFSIMIIRFVRSKSLCDNISKTEILI